MNHYLIAFGRRPVPGFLATLREIAMNDGVAIDAAVLTTGPGCYNLGFSTEAPAQFAEQLTFALMPAKYEALSEPGRLVSGQFVDEVHP